MDRREAGKKITHLISGHDEEEKKIYIEDERRKKALVRKQRLICDE